ncbi:Fic family protein [Thiotrichales bacterium 19X7-9]|nr:Fic family protein [Thiotrichales bacterium 19X7-9]
MAFPEEYTEFLFTDLKKHQFDELIKRFEEREPGYFRSLLCTFNDTRTTLRKSRFLTQDLLKIIHHNAMDGVENTNYKKYTHVKESISEYTITGNNFNVLPDSYTSIKGLKEWYNQHSSIWSNCCWFYDQSKIPADTISSIEELNQALLNAKITSEDELLKVFNEGNLYVHNSANNLRNDIQNILIHYNTQIQKPLTKHEKLELICKTVQQLERRHPFTDGNGRTFSMVLLNSLLEQNGFHFALQADPNRVDGLSLDQLVSEIEYSMKKTEIFENLYAKNPEIADLFIRLCAKYDHEMQLNPGINPGLHFLNDLEKMANLYYENDINTVVSRFCFDDKFSKKRKEIEASLSQNLIDKVSKAILEYKSKDKASFFNWQLFHRHGKDGIDRADKLQEIINKVNPKKPDTLADLHIFIHTFLNPESGIDKRSLFYGDLSNEDQQLLSGGNYNKSSLKTLINIPAASSGVLKESQLRFIQF